MYTVKKFKPMDTFKSESGFEYGGYDCGSTVYAVINENGECLHRPDFRGKMHTHFYSTKKMAQKIADAFNMKEGYIEKAY